MSQQVQLQSFAPIAVISQPQVSQAFTPHVQSIQTINLEDLLFDDE